MVRYCGGCGAESPAEQNFCSRCGASLRLQQEKESPKQDALSAKKDPEMVWVGSTDPNATRITQKQLGWGCLTFVVFIAIIVSGVLPKFSDFRGDDEDESREDTSQETAQVQERPSDLSATECLTVEGNVMAVEYNFSQGEATPSHVVMVLETTATDFEEIASLHSGSERDWLLKMAELSNSLGDFIESGAGDGDLIFDQLMNNYALVKQFCG
jgi:hypothetical protein